MRTARSIGWMLAVVLCASPLAGPVAAAPGCQHSLDVFLVRRVGTAPRPLQLSVVSNPRSDLGTIFVVTVRGRGARRVVPDDGLYVGMVLHNSASAWPVVYTAGGPPGAKPVTVPAASTPEEPPDSAACDLPVTGAVPPILMVDETTTDDFIVGAYDQDMRLDVSAGWTVTRLTGGAMQVFTRHHGGGTGAQVGPVEVEYFRRTPEVPGGRWGSVAFASLPCYPSPRPPARTGIGAGTLYGGGPLVYGSDRALTCDPYDIPFTVGGASGPTTWQLAGEAAGETGIDQRLMVFDLPPT